MYKTSSNLNNGFGPMSNRRDKKWKKLAAVGVIFLFYLLLGMHRITTKKLPLKNVYTLHDVVMCCGVLSAAMFGEFVRRLCLYAEEHQHSDTRYMGSKRKAMEACLCWSKLSKVILMMFAVVTTVIMYSWISGNHNRGYPIEVYLITALFGSLGTDVLHMKPPTTSDLSDLYEAEHKHVSDGLACIYYFGFLKLVLPGWDGMFEKAQGKGYQIKKEGLRAEDIRDKITDKRLFIIIPKDGYCYTPFEKIKNRIKFIQTMPDQDILRGGVQERTYKTSLYGILMEEGDNVYVMMEYATPLLSMYDLSKDKHASFSEENRKTQIVQFYKMLKKYWKMIKIAPETDDKFNLVDIIINAIKEKNIKKLINELVMKKSKLQNVETLPRTAFINKVFLLYTHSQDTHDIVY